MRTPNFALGRIRRAVLCPFAFVVWVLLCPVMMLRRARLSKKPIPLPPPPPPMPELPKLPPPTWYGKDISDLTTKHLRSILNGLERGYWSWGDTATATPVVRRAIQAEYDYRTGRRVRL